MRIVVLVKHVPCAIGGLSFAQDLTLERAGARSQLNDADACAVEQAWRVAIRRPGAQVTAVTMGPIRARQAIHQALVLGADEGVHILDDALRGCDAMATSRVLAAALHRLGCDLVFCGAAAADSAMSVVPAMVAQRLGLPVLCFADEVTVTDRHVRISRDSGHGTETLEAAVPAVVSVTRRSGMPRYPRYSAVTQAKHKLVRTWSLSRLGIDSREVGHAAATTRVRAVKLTGGKKRILVDDAPPTAAARLAQFLAARDLL